MTGKLKTISKQVQLRIAILTLLLFNGIVAMAQDPVTLEIPTDDIFTSINQWIQTFAPVIAIGIGIAAAIAILGFVGNEIVKAFKGGRR